MPLPAVDASVVGAVGCVCGRRRRGRLGGGARCRLDGRRRSAGASVALTVVSALAVIVVVTACRGNEREGGEQRQWLGPAWNLGHSGPPPPSLARHGVYRPPRITNINEYSLLGRASQSIGQKNQLPARSPSRTRVVSRAREAGATPDERARHGDEPLRRCHRRPPPASRHGPRCADAPGHPRCPRTGTRRPTIIASAESSRSMYTWPSNSLSANSTSTR